MGEELLEDFAVFVANKIQEITKRKEFKEVKR